MAPKKSNNRFQYSPVKVTKALEAIDGGMRVAKASKLFQVPRTTLRNKVSGKSPVTSKSCGPDSVLGARTEQLLVDWILECAKMGFPVDKEGLCVSVQKLISESNLKNPFTHNKPGKKWYYSFLKRHPIISRKRAEYVNKARGAVTEEKIRGWFDEVLVSLGDNAHVLNEPNRVFNMDETCFSMAPKGNLVLGERGQHLYEESTNSNKENITSLFAVNAVGEFAPPLTLYKYERIPGALLKAAPPNWGIGKTENGWMTAESFFEYIANVFDPFLRELNVSRPVIVFLDGHSSHLTLHLSRFCVENQIIVVALYPNSTHFLQPLDVAVFGPMKKMWKKIARKWRIDNNGKEISKFDVPIVLSNVMHESTMTGNIISGFKATGLYPFNVNNVNFEKIIKRKIESTSQDTEYETATSHLTYIESKINPDLLSEFHQMKKRNCDWEGNPEAYMLFKFWLDVTKDAENTVVMVDDEQVDQEQETPDLNSLDDSLLSCLTNHNENASIMIWGNNTEIASSSKTTPKRFVEAICSSNNTETPISPNTDSNTTKQSGGTIFIGNNTETPISSKIDSITPKRSAETIFKDVIRWPEAKIKNCKRKREHIPSVVTSTRWIEYHEAKEKEKQEKDKIKSEKKALRIKNQQMKLNKKLKLKITDESLSSSEDLMEKQTNKDVNEEKESGKLVELSATVNLKLGDFVIVKFTNNEKKKATIYRYVATILKVLSSEEFEITCLKSVNPEKTCFTYIENDVSTINIVDVIEKLPEPQLIQKGRVLQTMFPGTLDVFEKI